MKKYAASMVTVMEAEKKEIFDALENQAEKALQQLREKTIETENQVKMIYTEIEKTETVLKRSTSDEIVRFDGPLDTIRFRNDPNLQFSYFRFFGCEKNICNLNTEGIGFVERSFPSLYAKNLDDAIDDARLREDFSACGAVITAKVMEDNKNNSKGFGFVTFSSTEEATKVRNAMNGKILVSMSLYVDFDRRRPKYFP